MPDIFNSRMWRQIERWFYNDIATWSALVQFIGIVVLVIATRWLASYTVESVNKFLKSKSRKQIKNIFDLSIKEVAFLTYLTSALWITRIITDALSVKTPIIDSATFLVTAWVVVRLVSGLIEKSVWTRILAVIIWIIVALKILSIYDDATKLLDSYSFELGSAKLSLLTVLQAIISISILFWGAHLITELVENRFKNSRQLTRAQKVLFGKIIRIFLLSLAVIIGLSIVGIDLTTLAIFSSAIGFGVAFGLQKVFSNFISGIILLMDKSIQPGDVIAVGDTYGEVVNLEARYVSVVTRDGKAHLIPNEVLITEKVENWSFSDTLLRLRIPVGVSYDSDLRLVEKLIMEAASQHPRVLDDPEAKVLLKEFGDSSVNFELRVWIADPMNGLGMPQSEILFLIWEKFHENNIEIPFNRLDVKMLNNDDKSKKKAG